MKKSISVLLIVLFIGTLVIGCSKPESKSASSTANSAQQSKQVSNSQILALNESGKCDPFEITLLSVTKLTDATPFPKEGREYIVVTLRVKNISNKDSDGVSSSDFQVKPASGQRIGEKNHVSFKRDKEFLTVATNRLKSGEQAEGVILFEVPAGDKGMELHYIKGRKAEPDLRFKLDK